MKRRKQILHFDDINRCHEAMGFSGRTDLPDFHVYTIEETYPSTRKMMPPYTFRFYCITLHENSYDAKLEINAQRLEDCSDTVSFQPPGHVSSWVRGEAERGFILYFQPEFLGLLSIVDTFPFFRSTEVNVLPLTRDEKAELCEHFVRMVHIFKRDHPYRASMLQTILQALLFDCKGLYESYRQEQTAVKSTLARRYQQLVDHHFLAHQSVQAYADLLHVTSNHLSQAVSSALGRQAHEIIVDRVLIEAKKLLRYTDLSIAEIADYLGFDEPTHFGRFFKHHMAVTPLMYRSRYRIVEIGHFFPPSGYLLQSQLVYTFSVKRVGANDGRSRIWS